MVVGQLRVEEGVTYDLREDYFRAGSIEARLIPGGG
jgi:hypothetical protein